jgi:hypothetical protein
LKRAFHLQYSLASPQAPPNYIREEILKGNTATFRNATLEHLTDELKDDLFFKKTICAALSNLAGILSSTQIIKLLLGWKTTAFKLNIFDGHLEE